MLHYASGFNNMMVLAPQGDGSYITEVIQGMDQEIKNIDF